jgi:hypothetical protein
MAIDCKKAFYREVQSFFQLEALFFLRHLIQQAAFRMGIYASAG